MIHIAFCDDDNCFLKKIVSLVEKEFKRQKVKITSWEFNEGEKLIKCFKTRDPYFDIVFLDIDMPIKDGKQIAKELRIIDKHFKLIFVTAYEHEALNMFQYDVIGFLPKDKLDLYLKEAIKRVVKSIEENRPCMQFFQIYNSKSDEKMAEIKVALNDIIYFEVINRNVYMHTVFGFYKLYHYKFNDIVSQYIKCGFLDIHRTCIVNPKYVASVGESAIKLDNSKELFMSRRKRKEVLSAFVDDIYEEEKNRW